MARSGGDIERRSPPPGMLEKLILVFSRESVAITGSAPTRFTIDTNFVPARMDILNGRHQVGIYELKGDKLKVCFGMTAIDQLRFIRKSIPITPICCSSA